VRACSQIVATLVYDEEWIKEQHQFILWVRISTSIILWGQLFDILEMFI
jgi:hypothetical protein